MGGAGGQRSGSKQRARPTTLPRIMHYMTLLILCGAWLILAFASPFFGIPPLVVEDFKNRGGDVIVAGIFLYMLDWMVASIAQDSGYGSVTQQRHNEVLKALAERMDEINMMKRMLGGGGRKKLK